MQDLWRKNGLNTCPRLKLKHIGLSFFMSPEASGGFLIPPAKSFFIAVGFMLCLIMFSSCNQQSAFAKEPNYLLISNEKIADAIYKAENSQKYPYGIKSISTRGNTALARRLCLKSIANAKKRYCRSHCQTDFITFMGRRYSPPAVNPNWVKLVKFFINKELRGRKIKLKGGR